MGAYPGSPFESQCLPAHDDHASTKRDTTAFIHSEEVKIGDFSGVGGGGGAPRPGSGLYAAPAPQAEDTHVWLGYCCQDAGDHCDSINFDGSSSPQGDPFFASQPRSMPRRNAVATDEDIGSLPGSTAMSASGGAVEGASHSGGGGGGGRRFVGPSSVQEADGAEASAEAGEASSAAWDDDRGLPPFAQAGELPRALDRPMIGFGGGGGGASSSRRARTTSPDFRPMEIVTRREQQELQRIDPWSRAPPLPGSVVRRRPDFIAETLHGGVIVKVFGEAKQQGRSDTDAAAGEGDSGEGAADGDSSGGGGRGGELPPGGGFVLMTEQEREDFEAENPLDRRRRGSPTSGRRRKRQSGFLHT